MAAPSNSCWAGWWEGREQTSNHNTHGRIHWKHLNIWKLSEVSLRDLNKLGLPTTVGVAKPRKVSQLVAGWFVVWFCNGWLSVWLILTSLSIISDWFGSFSSYFCTIAYSNGLYVVVLGVSAITSSIVVPVNRSRRWTRHVEDASTRRGCWQPGGQPGSTAITNTT